jgi:hypothetical protein
LKCNHNLSNNDEIQKRSFAVGDEFLVNCMDSCASEIDSLEFFGSLSYSEDSAICIAAFHSGAIKPEGGDFLIKIGKGLLQYDSETRNGIASKSRSGDPSGKAL